MTSLETLAEQGVWKHFYKICSIPHISKHEEKLASYICDFAKQRSLDCCKDPTGNILITKKATAGLENKPTLILQAHLDMVPQKNANIIHDFLSDPIEPYIDGDWLRAKNTTLGADNGIGVSYILSILESETIKHGPIEALFTIDEEAGMSGALGIRPGFLKGRRLVNLDTEDDREIIRGCAGGKDCVATASYQEESPENSYIAFTLTVKGLKGGHSGIDINLGRANAIKLLFRLLYAAEQTCALRISSIHGGTIRNAIPREATAVIMIHKDRSARLQSIIADLGQAFNSEHQGIENEIQIECVPYQSSCKVLSKMAQQALMQSIYACPNGVIRMSNHMRDFVETSTNLGIINCDNGTISVNCLLRSSVESAMTDLQNALYCVLTQGNFNVTFTGGYPGWAPNPESSLLKSVASVYESEYEKKPDIMAVHAGLECGIIGAQYPDMESISCGPTIKFPHSPDERVSISSVNKFWQFLVKVLESV
jgi:dipeptidase D